MYIINITFLTFLFIDQFQSKTLSKPSLQFEYWVGVSFQRWLISNCSGVDSGEGVIISIRVYQHQNYQYQHFQHQNYHHHYAHKHHQHQHQQ